MMLQAMSPYWNVSLIELSVLNGIRAARQRTARQGLGIRNNMPEISTKTIKSLRNHKITPSGTCPIPIFAIHPSRVEGNPKRAMETKIQNT